MKNKTADALSILRQRYGNDQELQKMVEEERAAASVSRAIYDARKRAGVSQQELARRIDTSQSAIARLEDGDYDGHTVAILGRVAHALGLELKIVFVAPGAEEQQEQVLA